MWIAFAPGIVFDFDFLHTGDNFNFPDLKFFDFFRV